MNFFSRIVLFAMVTVFSTGLAFTGCDEDDSKSDTLMMMAAFTQPAPDAFIYSGARMTAIWQAGAMPIPYAWPGRESCTAWTRTPRGSW
jgi:hypothetical protein